MRKLAPARIVGIGAFYRARRANEVQNRLQGLHTTRAFRGRTTMTTDTHQPTAQIIQFPAGGRKVLNAKCDDVSFAAELRTVRAPAIAFGSSRYHDDAIQEAKRTGER
jgi:hypothetical protein